MITVKGSAVAEIATTFTDKATPTSAEILAALGRAYDAGYAQGAVSGSNATAKAFEMIFIPSEEVMR